MLFKLLKVTTHDLDGRTLREQLSAGINQVVERTTLYTMGWIAKVTKEDRFIDVLSEAVLNVELRRAKVDQPSDGFIDGLLVGTIA